MILDSERAMPLEDAFQGPPVPGTSALSTTPGMGVQIGGWLGVLLPHPEGCCLAPCRPDVMFHGGKGPLCAGGEVWGRPSDPCSPSASQGVAGCREPGRAGPLLWQRDLLRVHGALYGQVFLMGSSECFRDELPPSILLYT